MKFKAIQTLACRRSARACGDGPFPRRTNQKATNVGRLPAGDNAVPNIEPTEVGSAQGEIELGIISDTEHAIIEIAHNSGEDCKAAIEENVWTQAWGEDLRAFHPLPRREGTG